VESINQNVGQVLARTDVLTLERDGTTSGLVVRYPPSPGIQVLNAVGMNSAGVLVPFHTVLNNPASFGTVQICTTAQRLVHLQLSFGNAYGNGRLTQVVLDRTDDGNSLNDYYWVGTLTSNFNQ
jgi:hypothetical protein